MSGISGSDATETTNGASRRSNGRKTTAEPVSLGSTVGNTRSLNQSALHYRSTRVNQNVNAFMIWGIAVGVRDERRAERDSVVLTAAGELFWTQGYAATTIHQIAAKAGVAVGTVAKVGSKDSLFLRTWEEGSTLISLRLITEAAATSDTLTERVWTYVSQLIEAAIFMPQMLRDYFIAYMRAAEHEANIARLELVMDALTGMFPGDRKGPGSPPWLAAWTIWLSYSGVVYGLASKTGTAEQARRLMRAIVEAQCAPFNQEKAK